MESACTKSRFWNAYKNQLLATLAVNLIPFGFGHALGWLAPTLLILLSDNSPLESGAITVEDASWLGALLCAGAFAGNLLSGFIVDRIGRKMTLYLAAIPLIISWLLIIFGTHVRELYIARTLAGLCAGGMFLVVTMFLAEISDNKIRGTLASTFPLWINGGALSGYILGSTLNYRLFPCIVVSLPILFIISIYCLPDTPQYYLKINQVEQAERSLKFYRNFKGRSDQEIQDFNEYFNNLKETISGKGGSKLTEKLSISDFTHPKAVRGLFIGILLMILHQFSGMYALMSYTSTIFKLSGSTLDPNTCTIIVGSIEFLGTLTATNLVDRIGRRILLIVSTIGVATGLFSLGLFSFLSQRYDISHLSWIAVTSLAFAIFLGALGLLSMPFVVLAEILPQKIKSVSMTFCVSLISTFAFIVLKLFPVLMVDLGISVVMWICAGISATGAVLLFIFLPETKGKCLEKSDETN